MFDILCFYFRFGAGSEFGREARLKAKNKKYNSNKNLSETTSWNLNIEGKKYVF